MKANCLVLSVRVTPDAISSAGIEVAKSEVRMPQGPIRQTGEYDIDLHLHAEVDAVVRVVVVAE